MSINIRDPSNNTIEEEELTYQTTEQPLAFQTSLKDDVT